MNIYHSQTIEKGFLDILKKELARTFEGCKKIAIKIHFGEPGNKTSLKPKQISSFTRILKDLDMDFFFYDSSVAYKSRRDNPKDHKEAAEEKGWDELGEIRTNDDFIEVKGENMNYEVCKELVDADGVLVISHVKGHPCPGFGGAIKNLGMGALTKKTKSKIHKGGEPVFEGECSQCGECERACPLGSISIDTGPVFGTCVGCSSCIYACPLNLIKPRLNDFDTLLAEGASMAQSNFKKYYYISILNNITKKCDCMKNAGPVIAPDSGYLAGKDGVAIDSAARHIIKRSAGKDVFLKHQKKSGQRQIKMAESFGMGNKKYQLVQPKTNK